ncbi:MAG: enoyl-CoA hydratase/isomerase family protein [Flavobacteriaceae bacterium]|tara:strand:- start:2846 stop:3658 length:813 start_codon:yes stop_codon:yes gene_type:complete
MNYYKEDQLAKFRKEKFCFIAIDETNEVFEITLDRTAKKNAIHPQMLNELAFALQYAQNNKSIRVLVLRAKGDVFCSGSDLSAMQGKLDQHDSSIGRPLKEVLLVNLWTAFNKPSLAVVEGNVYAGGYLFLACCTFVIADKSLKFSLPETRRGIFPMQVMGVLMRVITPRLLLDWCIRGYEIDAQKAEDWGLISKAVNKYEIKSATKEWLKEVIANSPSAISLGMEAYRNIIDDEKNQKYLKSMLDRVINTTDAQEGLKAFKEKRTPKWK